MTLEDAMHAECDRCGELAMMHRLTDTGNFYCLEPNAGERWRKNYMTTEQRRQWAMSRAKCGQLVKSPLSKVKEIATTITRNWRTLPEETSTQLSL